MTVRRWVAVSEAPCAMDEDGLVQCWRSDELDTIDSRLTVDSEPNPTPIAELNRGLLTWGTSRTDGTPIGVVWLDGASEHQYLPSSPGYSDPSETCALRQGAVFCWDLSASTFPTDRTYVKLGGYWGRPIALDTENVVHVHEFRWDEDVNRQYPLPPELEVAELRYADTTACVLDVLGVITCFDHLEGLFDEPPYTSFAANPYHACAARARDGMIVCNDGSTFDWGPVRDLVISGSAAVWRQREDGTWTSDQRQWGDPPSLCAITETNAIRCTGWRYDWPDLQAQLPRGDEP